LIIKKKIKIIMLNRIVHLRLVSAKVNFIIISSPLWILLCII